jgi:hypothetical protein
MAVSASTGVAEVAEVAEVAAVAAVAAISYSMASIIRRELVTGTFKSGAAIDVATLNSKRSQLAAFDAANEGKRPRAAKWSSMLRSTVKVDGNTTRALVTREAVETRTAVALVAEDVRAGRAAAVDALDLLMGREAPAPAGDTDKQLIDRLQLRNRINHTAIRNAKEREKLRLRGLLGETPAARAARDVREQAATTRAETASAAKEEKAKKRKADALEKKEEKVAKRKADALEKKEAKRAEAKSGRASSSTKPRSNPKATPNAKDNPLAMCFKKQQTTLANFTDGLAELLDENGTSAAPMATVASGPVEQPAPGSDPVADPLIEDVSQNVANHEAEKEKVDDGAESEYSED